MSPAEITLTQTLQFIEEAHALAKRRFESKSKGEQGAAATPRPKQSAGSRVWLRQNHENTPTNLVLVRQKWTRDEAFNRRQSMKPFMIVAFALAIALPSHADEVTVRGAAWNDVSTALEITPFYIEAKSPTSACEVNLILKVFKNGEQVQTYSSGGISYKDPHPINLKSALFFHPKSGSSDYSVTWTLDWNEMSAVTRLTVPKSMIDLDGKAFAAATPSISGETESLLFTIVCNSDSGYSMGDSIESTIAANKNATVIGVFLERE